ncbi:MAG: GntR family transcriptional regulator [Planctomycetes bacterium]|nr:GntR family transcriptional regulator [Planctomycetota bacterium]
MLLRVDPRSAEPLFEQLVFQVKRAVAEGVLSPGARLPSVRELAKQLAINPNTVVRAIEALERDGVIVRRQGAGCFVSDKPSDLAARERARRLEGLFARAVTEAFHLGFGPLAIRAAVEERLAALETRKRSK